MQLIAILLTTVSILTLLSGIAVFAGSKKSDRLRSAWFFIATLFATIWMVTISLFLIATPEWPADQMTMLVDLTYISAIFIDIALLGYISWRYAAGKVATLIFLVAGIAFAGIFIANPSLLYAEIVLANTGNSLVTNIGPFYFTYIGFFCALVPAVLISLLVQILGSRSSRIKNGDLVLLVGFAISGTVSLIFNLILPLWTWSLIWLGPLAISTTIIAFYYTVLRYRALKLDSAWLRILSYIVLIASAAVLYMVVFYVIFLAMFRGSSPSIEVIVLNFIMVLFFLLMMPAMNEFIGFINSLISNQQMDIVYIVKRLSNIKPNKANMAEIAAFLAEHMHFDYVGILISHQVFGSQPRLFKSEEITMIDGLGDPERGFWQEFDENSDVWQELNLFAVAALKDSNGKTIGQIMFGRPNGKSTYNRRDLAEIETVVNLVSIIADTNLNRRKKTK